MLSNNRLRYMAIKNDFARTHRKYKEALKYYGFSEDSLATLNCQTPTIYPFPLLKDSRTLMKQASLPRLPVPSLESSISKYLKATKVILEKSEYDQAERVATDFIKPDGVGQKLQKLLVQKSKTTDNWLSQWWLEKVYLEPRYSVVINVNPASLYPKANYKTFDEQLMFAAKYVRGFLQFKNLLEDQKLPVDKLGDAFLCMDQYYKLIGSCRVPNSQKDLVNVKQVYLSDFENMRHITVIFKNRFFSLQVIDPATNTNLCESEIYLALKQLTSAIQHEGIGLGILTAENRDVWAEAYKELCKNPNNKHNFENVHDSLFVLCIDDKEPTNHETSIDTRSLASAQMLHGNKEFTSNRFFDKIIQVIIGTNGVWGVNFEHSIAEALPHSFMNDFIYNYIQKTTFNFDTNSSTNKNLFRELEFEVPTVVQNQITKSRESVFKMIDNLDLFILYFDLFGKNFPKSVKVSPDAFVQIAMQLAFYRMHKILGNAYESGSHRKFQLGRTEIIRACTSDAAQFVRAMTNEKRDPSECANLLLKAINSHRTFTNFVINGESFDRHLLGLRLIAAENNMEMPELYKDIAYKKLCHYYISSSQVSSKFEAVTSYGPAVDDGYGACYNILEEKLVFGLSSYKSNPQTNSKQFGDHIRNALIDCQNLFHKNKSKL